MQTFPSELARGNQQNADDLSSSTVYDASSNFAAVDEPTLYDSVAIAAMKGGVQQTGSPEDSSVGVRPKVSSDDIWIEEHDWRGSE
jgi:hypothetical protein